MLKGIFVLLFAIVSLLVIVKLGWLKKNANSSAAVLLVQLNYFVAHMGWDRSSSNSLKTETLENISDLYMNKYHVLGSAQNKCIFF